MPVQFSQTFTAEQVRRIAARHGLSGVPRLLPNSGMVNEAWVVGDAVVRIIRDAESDHEAEREAWVVPLVREAGVPTPELLTADLSKQTVPRPFTIYRKAQGVLLADAPGQPDAYQDLYRGLGAAIAKIGRIEVPEAQRSGLQGTSHLDARSQLKASADKGAVGPSDIGLIEGMLERLEGFGAEAASHRFIHRDIHPWNFFIDSVSGRLECIIDWGDAAWGEPAVEFASMPLCALSPMLEGYCEAGDTLPRDLLIRSLYIGMALALWEVRGLDPEVFKREWWRCPVGGWEEELRWHEKLLAS